MAESMMIGKQKVDIRREDLLQADLKFYAENPRVHSLLAANGISSQEEIEECMRKQEHVKSLKLQIKTHGGLIDPLVVRDGDFTVLEGNSRLAAYRMLFEENPAMWGKVRCMILPQDIGSDLIFQLLGQYHVAGKTPWSPYEQASFLARQLDQSKKPMSALAKPLGLNEPTANKMVEAYRFMVEKDDNNARHWSYYFEFIKGPQIKKCREWYPSIDDVITRQIKSGEISDARDIRKLGEMAKSSSKIAKKALKKISEGAVTLNEGYDEVKETGVLDDVVKKLKKFKMAISEETFATQCITHKDKNSVDYELKHIAKMIADLRKKLGQVGG